MSECEVCKAALQDEDIYVRFRSDKKSLVEVCDGCGSHKYIRQCTYCDNLETYDYWVDCPICKTCAGVNIWIGSKGVDSSQNVPDTTDQC